jgi:hypothetical protein
VLEEMVRLHVDQIGGKVPYILPVINDTHQVVSTREKGPVNSIKNFLDSGITVSWHMIRFGMVVLQMGTGISEEPATSIFIVKKMLKQ